MSFPCRKHRHDACVGIDSIDGAGSDRNPRSMERVSIRLDQVYMSEDPSGFTTTKPLFLPCRLAKQTHTTRRQMSHGSYHCYAHILQKLGRQQRHPDDRSPN
eukprot:scaffold1949_cov348-Pavlova_lutheri.AAC.6